MVEDDAKRLEEGFGNKPVPEVDEEEHKKDILISTEKVVYESGGSGDIIDRLEEKKSVSEPREVEQVKGEEEQPLQVKQKSKRVATLDAFRGLTIVVMILVDDAGGAYSRIDHSPWNGCTLADFVMPFFLFIVGVAIALALKRIPKTSDAIKKIILRTIKLLFWGIILQGGYSHAPYDLAYGVDMKKIRWFGILQRIALVYCVVALIETFTTKLRPTVLESGPVSIFTAYRWQWIGGFVAFLVYMITTFSLYVPDWSFVVHHDDGSTKKYLVECGMRGHLGPACNAVGYVDRQVWGINHLYNQPVWSRLKACTLSAPSAGPFRKGAPSWCRAPFEPEGLLSSISAILSGTIGIHYGHILIHFKGHAERLKQWVSMGLVLIIIGIILHFTDAIPINKQLYSFSYVCFTAGAAGLVFSGFYVLIDVWGYRTPFLFLEWIGMNAMLVFVMAAQGIFAGFVNGWYYESPDKTLVYWIQEHVFNNVWHSERLGTLLYVIFAEITFWGVVSGILHKLGIYWKL
ncbi:putative heparan-alpha-glucosaminide N-acetyltransferase [Rosa chinensis]|uniref:Putative heparan-alpha-glucosaminide N-acetyltransferase n=1 Tax=Rosa chinensis TaxID=74649 RepID=A0A2P6RB41_ROSCH|nr:heparan-alpha-glucosaminide N-acetyltransferase [Rosa chinensis]PRQ43636.1 putative heparan-alpha-glucosaminide N-acetyltransferase [Rosa chinensis]